MGAESPSSGSGERHHRLVEVRLLVPGHPAGEALVEDEAEEEDVGLGRLRGAPADDLLGSAVAPAVHHPLSGGLLGRHRERAVAAHLRPAGEGQHHRLGAQIAVDERSAVVVAGHMRVVHAQRAVQRRSVRRCSGTASRCARARRAATRRPRTRRSGRAPARAWPARAPSRCADARASRPAACRAAAARTDPRPSGSPAVPRPAPRAAPRPRAPPARASRSSGCPRAAAPPSGKSRRFESRWRRTLLRCSSAEKPGGCTPTRLCPGVVPLEHRGVAGPTGGTSRGSSDPHAAPPGGPTARSGRRRAPHGTSPPSPGRRCSAAR